MSERIEVSEYEFSKFIVNYPNKLIRNYNGSMDLFEYADPELGKWPENVVATHDPDYQGSGADQTYRISKFKGA